MSCLATGVRTQLLCLGPNRPPSCRSQPDAGAAQCRRSDGAFRADGAPLPSSPSALLFGAALVTGGGFFYFFFKVPSPTQKGPAQSSGGWRCEDRDRGGMILQRRRRRRHRDAPVASTDPEHLLSFTPVTLPRPPQLRRAPPALWDDVTV